MCRTASCRDAGERLRAHARRAMDEYVVTCPFAPNRCPEEAAKLCSGDCDRVGKKSDNQAGTMLVKCRLPTGK
jgi:hypothetical protein